METMFKEFKASMRMFYLIENINEETDFKPEETRVWYKHGKAKESKDICDHEVNA